MHILPLARRPKPGVAPLAHIEAALNAGDILILFPEGSRGEPEKRGALKSGIAHLMEHAPGVPVVPIYLHGLGKALPKGEWLPVPFFADGFIGEAFTWQGARAPTMQALEERFKALEAEGRFSDWTD
jgi:1-acyl-sn-glycerol-3-phosphate acyltransferase